MIRSFKDKETERVFNGAFSKRFPENIQQRSLDKLNMIDVAESLNDLAVFPGNQLEPLKGDRKGQHSIRINKQWRICFTWRDGQAFDVEITDYH